MKGLTSIDSVGVAELESLIDRAEAIRGILDHRGEVPAVLARETVINAFFEPSTRTRLSFESATQRLGGHTLTLDGASASIVKGESLRDTALTLAAIGAGALVVRSRDDGLPQQFSDWTGLPVINAGDGMNEHPTQALLDAMTIRRRFGHIEQLDVAVVGDIAHSRVAGSLMRLLPALGARVTLVGPQEWLPETTLVATTDLDSVLPDVDVAYLLRVQTERGGVIGADYRSRYQLDEARAAGMKPDAVIMHPGPVNRGVEIADCLVESARSLVMEQVRNGVPTRMAVLEAIGAAL